MKVMIYSIFELDYFNAIFSKCIDQLLRNTGAEMEPLVIKSEIEVENDNSGECIRNVLEDDDDEEDDVEDWSQQVMDEVTDEEEDDDDEETDLSRDPLEDVDDYFR